MSGIKLFDYQKESLSKLRSGSILCGGVGSGKSITALAYYFVKECGGSLIPFNKMERPLDLFIITTARKRDTLEWEQECTHFGISSNTKTNVNNVSLVVDSWNNIGKYVEVKNAFFIFDEQRVVGSGAWVKAFLKITKNNKWLLLSATPGDTWLDYVPVFVANGFYKNRTDFIRSHVIFNSFVKYPKVDHFVDTWKLIEHRKNILVHMNYKKPTIAIHKNVMVDYDKDLYEYVSNKRWNIFDNTPITNITELCYIWRKISNIHETRIEAVKDILANNKKVIVFYNFNYELDILREIGYEMEIPTSEWNGHKHQKIPFNDSWLYLVQYTSGAEGWNCVETNTIVFYSQNYSYKIMHQAAGRIDRLNTEFRELYYYHLLSGSKIDLGIAHCLKYKKDFNEKEFSSF
jgi:hypothetical protein